MSNHSLVTFSSKIIIKRRLYKFDSLHASGDRPVYRIWPNFNREYSTMPFYVCTKFETKILSLTEVIGFTRNCLHTYIHTYIHTHIHTHIHTYIHTYTQTFLFDI